MLSRAYQTATGHNAKKCAADPRNAYLSTFQPRRLDAEELHDAMLMVSETGSRHGAPISFPRNPSEVHTARHCLLLQLMTTTSEACIECGRGSGENPSSMRSMAPIRGPLRVSGVMTTALQALFTMNNLFVAEQADAMAVRVGMLTLPTKTGSAYAYKLAYGRTPSAAEFSDAIVISGSLPAGPCRPGHGGRPTQSRQPGPLWTRCC